MKSSAAVVGRTPLKYSLYDTVHGNPSGMTSEHGTYDGSAA